VVNPKAWLAIAAVFASGRLAQGPVADAVAKVALLTVVVAAIHVGWLLAGRLLTPLLRVPRAARAVHVGLAAVLVGAAAVAVLP
jgi:threonine/homoserine/homoserine lactone efflux protein